MCGIWRVFGGRTIKRTLKITGNDLDGLLDDIALYVNAHRRDVFNWILDRYELCPTPGKIHSGNCGDYCVALEREWEADHGE